ncbi:hypothetical protein CNMCM5793_003576 [Aspergillus hiratsukae]|uniref:General transcription and DNA repair factor IIH subunit TFB4 n=1 Tax=Aspergillus hiratsukae TaxID=1194566 RepID=A0A8H6Q8V8_9EURO|nr:hypothetical protein CNMCM5793_003576 [Aspergillus hiratsukae]KAF7168656.1 hypothetical protein CNMCM6106_003796 [Aspergillus hiratsukae]
MNAVDATEHYETSASDPAPSLLTIILDTNPHAWALLEASLPLSTAIANILVFVNAHLACNYANEVAVVASHAQKATWLYPCEIKKDKGKGKGKSKSGNKIGGDEDDDVAMNGSGAGAGAGSAAAQVNNSWTRPAARTSRPLPRR